MLEKFTQNNNSDNLRRWLNTIDLSSADILEVERSIYSAILKAQRKSFHITPISPLAEPVNLNELTGDGFNIAQSEIIFQTRRLDNVYSWLSETNNVLKLELETIEKVLTETSDDVQHISIVVGDESKNFLWVSDSFNSLSFVDLDKTSSLVDTDYGMTTLAPTDMAIVADYKPELDLQYTNGIPGANIVVLSEGYKGLENAEPQPILENKEVKDFSSMFDADSQTWFEIERNFIPQRQKLKKQGRAYVYSTSGVEQDVRQVTVDYDWKAVIEWPGKILDGGSDGNGRSLVEWRDLDNENILNNQETKVHLVFDCKLNQPSALSFVKLLPLLREGNKISIESLQILVDGLWIDIAKNKDLGSNLSTSRLETEILRRTGIQSTGQIFAIPTDRFVSQIRVHLSAEATEAKYGLAHLFKDVERHYRTERNHGLWRTANTWNDWGREPVDSNPPTIVSKDASPKLVGSLRAASTAAYTLGRLFNSVQEERNLKVLANTSPIGSIAGSVGSVAQALSVAKIGGTLGAVGSWLGRAVPILGAVLAIDALVGGLFAVEKSEEIVQVKGGYDIFKGYRSSIAIRDFSLLQMKYSGESIIQSTRRDFLGPVSKVGLFVNEYIPEAWGPGDWITYFVSIDGDNWLPIPKLTDSTLENSLSFDTPISSLFFKAILRGNPNDPYHSPAVLHYSFQGLPV